MADALISGVVEQLINILNHQAQDLKRVLGVKKEIKNLSSKLEKIREVLDDAEKRSFKETGIKLWIENIQDFSYQVDDVLDEWRTRTLAKEEAGRNSIAKMTMCNLLLEFNLPFSVAVEASAAM
nr:putative disease resistance RPP13-like protein 1 [Ipomoea trifida]